MKRVSPLVKRSRNHSATCKYRARAGTGCSRPQTITSEHHGSSLQTAASRPVNRDWRAVLIHCASRIIELLPRDQDLPLLDAIPHGQARPDCGIAGLPCSQRSICAKLVTCRRDVRYPAGLRSLGPARGVAARHAFAGHAPERFCVAPPALPPDVALDSREAFPLGARNCRAGCFRVWHLTWRRRSLACCVPRPDYYFRLAAGGPGRCDCCFGRCGALLACSPQRPRCRCCCRMFRTGAAPWRNSPALGVSATAGRP